MTESPKPARQFGLWDLLFWLTYFTAMIVAPATAALRGAPLPAGFGAIAAGILLVVYRARHPRLRFRTTQQNAETRRGGDRTPG